MLRSSSGSDPRHTTQLPDNKRDTSVKGSEDGTPPISKSQFDATKTEQPARDPQAGHNALQESAYRLHALVKRSSPQKPAHSPIRFNKTAPLPSLTKSLYAPKRAAGGPATGGVGKAPPSPRRSPLRGRAHEAEAGPPQTKNVVERMIAYARHAASQEDPGMVQRDRQNFVTRLADRAHAGARAGPSTGPSTGERGERGATSRPHTPKESPRTAAPSAYPIMSNLSLHANLRKQQAAHTAPIAAQDAGEDGARQTLHRRASSAAESASVLREAAPSEAAPSEAAPREEALSGRAARVNDRLNEALFDPLTAELNSAPPAQPSAADASSVPRRGAQDLLAGERTQAAAGAAPSTPQRGTRYAAQRPPSLGTPSGLGAAVPTRSPPPAWDKERWRVFIQAMRESFGASGVPAKDAVNVFNELMHRLPPDMRGISVQEIVHRLNAWIRSTARAPPPRPPR